MEPLTSEVATIGTLLVVKYPLIIFHQAAQLLSQLQSQVLLGSGLSAVHHHCLCWLVQGSLMGVRQRKQRDIDQTSPHQTLHDSSSPISVADGPYHQLLVNDHLTDDGVHSGQIQLKHVRQRLHAGKKEGREQGVVRTLDHKAGPLCLPPQGLCDLMES